MKKSNTTSEGDSRPASAPGKPVSHMVLLQVPLWADDAAEAPPPAFAMVADLLQVRGGELRDSAVGSVAAAFSDPAVALNAARNVQRLVQGFSRAWQGGVLGGCSLLTHANESGGGIDVSSLRGNPALKQVHPGQVVVAGSLCDAVRSIPGLEFRAMAGVASAEKKTAAQALQLLPPTRMEGFIDEPFEPRPIVRVAPVATEVTAQPVAPPPVEPRAPAYDLVSSPASGKSRAVAAVAPSRPASGSMPAVPFGATAAPATTAGDDEIGAFSREEKPSGGNKLWAILGGVAAVIVAGVLLFTHVLRGSPQPAASQPAAQPASAPSQPSPVAAESVPTPKESPVPVPAKTKANDAAHGKNATHVAEAPASPAPAPESAPAPLEDIRPAHGLTFTPAEISSLIAHADKDSGNGNFDKAIQEYRVVLSREPANDLAKRGLARAEYNKAHQ